MYRKNQLITALEELNVNFEESENNFYLKDEVKFKIATPVTEFVFNTDYLKLHIEADDFIIQFKEIYFKTGAPFVDFIPTKDGYLHVRLSNTKF